MATVGKSGIFGTKEIAKVLDSMTDKYANNLMRSTVHGIAGEVRKESKKEAPKDRGDLIKGIKTKRRKSPPRNPVSDVISKRFYWRFVEHGTKLNGPNRFVARAASKVGANLDRIAEKQFKKKLISMVNREKKKAAKASK